MLRHVALVRTDVSEALRSSETSVLTRATRRNISEDAVLLRENSVAVTSQFVVVFLLAQSLKLLRMRVLLVMRGLFKLSLCITKQTVHEQKFQKLCLLDDLFTCANILNGCGRLLSVAEYIYECFICLHISQKSTPSFFPPL
jgi:glucose-6-phosphate-specific signal transduction histidine kinase